MTNKRAFTDDEWRLVSGTPTVVGTAVAHAGHSGFGGTVKEIVAVARNMLGGRKAYPDNELIQAITTAVSSADRQAAKEAAEVQNEAFKQEMTERGVNSPEALATVAVEDCARVIALLNERATASEVADYKAWVLSIAQRVSEAAKEGGFLGIGGERVSEAESALIGRISDALNS